MSHSKPKNSSVPVYVLIVWGMDDRIVDPSAVAEFPEGITSSQSAIFADCGHALPRDCPDALVDRYLAFLRPQKGFSLRPALYDEADALW